MLWSLGGLLCLVWLGFALVSRGFAYGTVSAERPFLLLAVVVGLALAGYFVALHCFGARGKRRVRGREVLAIAVLIRLPLLFFSHPVQEIDVYRYLWDGRSLAEGVSPYRYRPADLDRFRENAGEDGDTEDAGTDGRERGPGKRSIPPDAARLLGAQERSEPLETIFSRIDHRHVPTIYPVVTQAVFAGAAVVMPERASVFAQMGILRGLLALFDLGTVALLLLLAKRLRLPAGFAIAYAWCPLVLKEFANSAHMDSVAVFFTVAAFAALVPGWCRARGRAGTGRVSARRDGDGIRLGAAAALLVLAIFAKWYPLVLVPVFLSLVWSRARIQGLAAMLPALGLALVLLAVTFRMGGQRGGFAESAEASRAGETAQAAPGPSGLRTFLTRWEMNDFVFHFVHDNLRAPFVDPETGETLRPRAWFALAPESWGRGWEKAVRSAESRLGIEGAVPFPAFFGAQLLCGGVLALVVAGFAFRRWPEGRTGGLAAGRAVFLVLATSWILSATQNPWYWIWALPFAGFARSRIWLAVSALALIYYARFWFIYQYPEAFWRDYDGQRFFDEIVVWFEHGPVLLAVACLAARRVFRKWAGIKRPARASTG